MVIGPIGLADGRKLLPGSEDLARFVGLVRLYAKDPLHFDLLLRFKESEAPALTLGGEETQPLGWLSWLGEGGPREREVVISMRGLDPLSRGRRSGRTADGAAVRGLSARPEAATSATRRH
jgi:predicted component of type VI protein secretion system